MVQTFRMLFIKPAIWLSGCWRGLPGNGFKSSTECQTIRSVRPRGSRPWVLGEARDRRIGLVLVILVMIFRTPSARRRRRVARDTEESKRAPSVSLFVVFVGYCRELNSRR